MQRILAIVIMCGFSVVSTGEAAGPEDHLDEGSQKVFSLPIESVSFGMHPEKIVAGLVADGYEITKESPANSQGIRYWQLQKRTPSNDRHKVELSATKEAAKSLEKTFVSGYRGGLDMNAEVTRLTAHFGTNPCENARRMFRCYFPDGNRNGEVALKATIDSRMYSLEFSDKRK